MYATKPASYYNYVVIEVFVFENADYNHASACLAIIIFKCANILQENSPCIVGSFCIFFIFFRFSSTRWASPFVSQARRKLNTWNRDH